jgi:protoporphyrinogen oxidase
MSTSRLATAPADRDGEAVPRGTGCPEPDDAAPAYDVAILGCGVSGLVAASIAAREGLRTILLDDYPDPGGNHLSRIVDGREFDIGAIYFHAGDSQFRHFPALEQSCRACQIPVLKITPGGAIGPYPFSAGTDLRARGAGFAARALLSGLAGRLRYRHAENAGDYARSRLGAFFYEESGLRFYMERLLGSAPNEVDISFARQRLDWLTSATRPRHVMAQIGGQIGARIARRLRSGAPRARDAASLVRAPGGFAPYYDRAVQALRRQGVRVVLDAGMAGIAPLGEEGGVALRCAAGTVVARRVVSTIPIDAALGLVGLPPSGLTAVTLLSLFVCADALRREDWCVLYNFTNAGRWKRITAGSRLYGPVGGREHVTVEIPIVAAEDMPAAEEAFAEFLRDIAGLGIFDGRVELVGHMVLRHAYPRLLKGYRERRDAALAQLEARGVFALGRQGRFDYIPHSSIATDLVERGLAPAPGQAPILPPAATQADRRPASR